MIEQPKHDTRVYFDASNFKDECIENPPQLFNSQNSAFMMEKVQVPGIEITVRNNHDSDRFSK